MEKLFIKAIERLGGDFNSIKWDDDEPTIKWAKGSKEFSLEAINKEMAVLKKKEQELLKKKQKRQARQKLLTAGALTADKKFWFNESWAKTFMIKVSGAEAVGLDYVKWKDANRKVVKVSLDKAKGYIKEMIAILDKVYLG